MDLAARRRFFAEELEAVCRLRSTRLVDAFATGPREAFLPPGPWTVFSDADFAVGAPGTRLTADADPARVLSVVAIYSAVGVRADDLNERAGRAMMAGPQTWMAVTRLRRDAHEPSPTCWLHGRGVCFSMGDPPASE
jgi:hypothetical protein